MDMFPAHPPTLAERMAGAYRRAVRLATRFAIAFGLATIAAIVLGAAVTDDAFAQIAVTVLAAFGLWIPFALLVAKLERVLERRQSRRASRGARQVDPPSAEEWRRLAAIAPVHSQRVAVLQRSIAESRIVLGGARLDPDAHDLCVLIDRRLPELIRSELEHLPPDDRNRSRRVSELLELLEQFARHCSRKRAGEVEAARREAEVLRRRFEARLSEH